MVCRAYLLEPSRGVLDDPRHVPYLMVWKDLRSEKVITIERPLPRNGAKARFVVCPLCQKPRRALYGWRVNRRRTNSVFLTSC